MPKCVCNKELKEIGEPSERKISQSGKFHLGIYCNVYPIMHSLLHRLKSCNLYFDLI
ncbi:hypothetical protein MOUN0_E05512 [Monosporozyma unispora]